MSVPGGGAANAVADCPAGKTVINGGAIVSNTSQLAVANLSRSATRWTVTGRSFGSSGTVTAIAVCA